ncbi:hypothetical protein DFH94DRAFT_678687 [Russula ochroleuca]|uniref:Uncharacterized protein n=1 Tax=Russula ochroleuca TaxID=152965 RepID=A0A9P5N431_9AGAM|nr:hypothetical protein DFH94DRAFT_678687 [Russula ochroleuca]
MRDARSPEKHGHEVLITNVLRGIITVWHPSPSQSIHWQFVLVGDGFGAALRRVEVADALVGLGKSVLKRRGGGKRGRRAQAAFEFSESPAQRGYGSVARLSKRQYASVLVSGGCHVAPKVKKINRSSLSITPADTSPEARKVFHHHARKGPSSPIVLRRANV